MTKTENIYRIIEKTPFKQITLKGLTNKTGLPANAITSHLSRLRAQGKIIHSKSGRDGIYAINQEITPKFYGYKKKVKNNFNQKP